MGAEETIMLPQLGGTEGIWTLELQLSTDTVMNEAVFDTREMHLNHPQN